MNGGSEDTRPIVVCPLKFELAALRRAGLGRFCDLRCCGPGGERMESWIRSAGPTNRPVVLAGLAGSLVEHVKMGSAWVIGEVVDPETQERWHTPVGLSEPSEPGQTCAIASVGASLVTRQAKAALHTRAGTELVDLESAAFARGAKGAGWRWAIVRGVSDDLQTPLPKGVDCWVGRRGGVRPAAVIGWLIRHPDQLSTIRSLRIGAQGALRSAAILIQRILCNRRRPIP
ncbi:MAG: hypothetical protein L0Y42_04400 [Phycisphaerales bacterium]|nr:hypothetical protein [Phycisphaerales bacterium]